MTDTRPRTAALSAAQIKALKGMAHHLEPGMIIGHHGLSDSLIGQIDQHIKKRELTKIKLPDVDRDERRAMAEELAQVLGATLVQIVGRVATLYRPADQPKIVLPKS